LGGHPAHGRALLLSKFKRELAPPPLNQNYLHRLLRFLGRLAACFAFPGVFIDSRGGSFPTFATGFRRFRRSLAKFPEFEFLELGMILFLQVLIVASGMPA
jgi:hypothetical protein